jgi:GntR family transcriptional regulator
MINQSDDCRQSSDCTFLDKGQPNKYYCYNIITFVFQDKNMINIDRTSPVPLYYQLKQILVQKIEEAEWAQGDMIPSEQELQERYGLSRTTVRQTLSELVQEGRLIRHRGKGTFITSPKIAHDPTTRLDFSEHLRRQGLTPGWKLQERQWIHAAPDVAAALGIEEDDRVYKITLTLLADGEAIARHNSFLPVGSVTDIDRPTATDEEILTHIRNLPKTYNCSSARTFEAVGADAQEAEELNITEGDPVLSIEIRFIAETGQPVELLRAAFRGDRFKYQISL